jgi:hypothetical protein
MIMAYTSVVPSVSPQRNPPCRQYEVDQLLHRCFRSDILPDRADHKKFDDSQIFEQLYTPRRAWRDAVEPPDSPHPHESHLDRLFWDDSFPRSPICVLGAVGCGKSTLIDYYLRCHCPTKSERREDCDKKLILIFDARTIRDNTDFYHRFFLYLQSEMRERCLERGYNLDEAVRSRPTRPQNVREWVHAAFEELSRVVKRPMDAKPPFQFVALVIDNLDQASIDVQIRAVTEVEQWLHTPSIRLWRVFLPMWPTTFRALQNHQLTLLRGARTFEVGPIEATELVSIRERALQARLRKLGFGGSDSLVEYFADMARLSKDRLFRRINGLSHGNLRHILSLWESLLCGDAAHCLWRQSQGSRRSFEYELLDALLVGANDVLDHKEHRIANLFAMGVGRVKPRDLLIGHHALQLLAQGRDMQADLRQALVSLGYSNENIAAVEKSILTFNFLHQEPTADGSVAYEIHKDVVHEYIELRFEPAYVDNVALVTPVDPKYLPRMARTRGDRADDFTRRVGTTLAFIEFVRECEDQIRNPELVLRVSAGTLAQALGALQLDCLWVRMALRYQERLVGLRESGFLRSVDADWWETTLANPLFAAAQAAPRHLVSG